MIEQEEIFLQPFKQETNHGHMTESSRKPDARNKSDSKIRHTKRNVPRQAWPHETLRDIKVHKSAGWRHSVTEAVNTEMRNERDSPRSKAKNDNVPRVNQERKHESTHVLAKSQSVSTSNRHDKTDVSHAPERNKKILDNPDRLSSVTNVKELDIATGKSKALQSSRSASSCVSKQSKVSSKRPVTKPLHLGKSLELTRGELAQSRVLNPTAIESVFICSSLQMTRRERISNEIYFQSDQSNYKNREQPCTTKAKQLSSSIQRIINFLNHPVSYMLESSFSFRLKSKL